VSLLRYPSVVRVIEIAAGSADPTLLLLERRSLALVAGGVLRVVDLDAPGATPHVIEGVVSAAATGTSIVTLQAGGRLSRWDRSDRGDYRATRTCDVDARDRATLAVSPSGRFVVVDGAEAQIVDLDSGKVIATLHARIGTARPTFDRFPDGREVLFVAAPGYMSVAVYAPGQVDPIAGYTERESWDFCHVGFRLAPHGDLLFTFGCVWAAPYETRIYDARPWTRDAVKVLGEMLPIVRIIRPLASNTLLETDVGEGGTLTSTCLEMWPDLQADDDGDLTWDPDALAVHEPTIAAKLRALPDGTEAALIVRALDPVTAETTCAGVWGVPRVREVDLHYLDRHRVLAVGSEIVVADPVADRLVRHGRVDVAPRDRSATTRDGEVVVIARG
jgi:hypothetical protein